MKYRFAWTLIIVAAWIAAIAVRVQGLPEAESEAGATYTDGTLRVSIPYRGIHTGAGQLTVEVLSPEDEVMGRVERRVEAGAAAGLWSEEVPLGKALPLKDLVWQRVRYRFTYSGAERAGGGGHGFDFAHPAAAGGPHSGAAIVPGGRQCGGAGDRDGYEEPADRGGRHAADRGREGAAFIFRAFECARNGGGAVPAAGGRDRRVYAAVRGGDADRRGRV